MIITGLLGASGSIGFQAVKAIQKHQQEFIVDFISINKNIAQLQEILQLIKIRNVFILDSPKNPALIQQYPQVNFYFSKTALAKHIKNNRCHIILNAIAGFAGFAWSIKIIKSQTNLALANKETMVVGGRIINQLALKNKVTIIPVDSEHSAIFQCLNNLSHPDLKKIILTASGGPFFNYSAKQLANVTLKQALKHPNWKMASKITIDSSTLFNKALEIIEARWLFKTQKIEVLIHPQSIIHSLVEFRDNSVLAQLGIPDMQIPILFALSYPRRLICQDNSLDLATINKLQFFQPDTKNFPALNLAFEALKREESFAVVLNAANEAAVSLFLKSKISYNDIYKIVKLTLNNFEHIKKCRIADIFAIDNKVKKMILHKWG